MALFAGADGLDVVRALVAQAAARGVAFLALEIGAGQAPAVALLVRAAGFARTRVAARPRRHRAGGRRVALTADDAATFARCMSVGGVAVFPADTVYGLACEPDAEEAVARLYELKGRAPDKPAAVMFFALDLALAALPELGPRTSAALRSAAARRGHAAAAQPGRALPAGLRGGPGTLGLRVPALPPALARARGRALAGAAVQRQPRRRARRAPLGDVPEPIRAGADLVLDGGELPGTPSTVVDLRAYELDARVDIVREGALAGAEVRARLQSAA